MQQVRWFMRVLDKWNLEKNRFEPANEPVEAGFSLYIFIRAYDDVIKWKNAMEKLDFTSENVINCVHEMDPRYGTQNVPSSILKYCTNRLWKQSAICTIFVSV